MENSKNHPAEKFVATSFSGEIQLDDFNTYHPNKNRIKNQIIAEDHSVEVKRKRKCMDEDKKYKSMTLEELRELRLISNTNGRPTLMMTDEKWQKEFHIRKLFITPYPKNVKRLGGKYSKESGYWNEETSGVYYGTTNWQDYCSFINETLRNLKRGQVEYTYFIYQILDLLKFHYDDLRTKYIDGYWEVWLEK